MLQSEFLPQVRRFLTTLHQFAADISPEVGDRVRHLVLGLLVSASCRRWSSLGDDSRLPRSAEEINACASVSHRQKH